jgi:hypothetical protein
MAQNLDNVDLEFKDLIKIDEGDSGYPQDFDCMHPMPQFCAATDDLEKLFQGDDELQKRDVVRSEMKPNRNSPAPESKPVEEQTCEEVFDCEKRSSSRGTVKLFKRLIPETNEIAIEAFDYRGECTSTRFASAEEIDEGSPLAKSEIMSQMNKTLSQVRASMTAEEVVLAEKAIRSLDVPAFLEIIRSAQAAA